MPNFVLSEYQLSALKDWIEAAAQEAVANDRPAHNRLAKSDRLEIAEALARTALLCGDD